MPRVPASRTRRSKAEVEKEFEKIAEDAVKQQEASSPITEQLSKVREQEIRHAVESLSVDGVVQRIS